VISVTVSSLERSYTEYNRLPSPIYQYVINLVVTLPTRRGPDVLMNVAVRNMVRGTSQIRNRSEPTQILHNKCH